MLSIDAILKKYTAVDYTPEFVVPKVVVEKIKSDSQIEKTNPPARNTPSTINTRNTRKQIMKSKKKKKIRKKNKKMVESKKTYNPQTKISIYKKNITRLPKSLPIKFSAQRKKERRRKQINIIVALIDDKTIRTKLIELGVINQYSTAPPDILRHIYTNIKLTNAIIKKTSSI